MPLRPGFYEKRISVFDDASANSSTYTSSDHYVADYRQMSVSWATNGGVASVLTLTGSNDDGLRASINTYSTLSAIVAQGMYTIDPGPRWIRAERASTESQAIVFIQGRS